MDSKRDLRIVGLISPRCGIHLGGGGLSASGFPTWGGDPFLEVPIIRVNLDSSLLELRIYWESRLVISACGNLKVS